MTEQTAVVLKKADAPMEWGNRAEIGALADRLAVMLPNAKDLNRDEILTAAQYCRMMDLNPFRGEVYFYKSKGKLTVVDGYKALARWANDKARYSTWDEDLPLEGDQVEHVRVWILRDDRAHLLEQYTKLGAKFTEAMQIAAHYADGIVTKSDTVARDGGSKEPPVGWTWRDVARKRAFKNALNLSHGAPSPREIAAMSWTVDGVHTIPEDWDGTEQLTPPEAEQTAKLTAATRETVEAFKRLTPAEQQAKAEANNVLLNGEADFEGFDTPPMLKQIGSEWDEALFVAAEPKPKAEPPIIKERVDELLERVARPQPESPKPATGRPLDAAKLREVIRKKSGWQGDERRLDGEPITEKQIPYTATLMDELFPNLANDLKQKARHDVLNYLIGVTSTKDLTKAEASALIDWMQDKDAAQIEAARIIEAIAVEAGQIGLPL